MRKKYSAKQKAQIVLEILREERSITQIASEHGIHPNQLYRWKAQVLEGLPDLFNEKHKGEKNLKAANERKLQELFAEIGRLSTQLNWLKKKSGIELLEK